jgi:hypothetical protein
MYHGLLRRVFLVSHDGTRVPTSFSPMYGASIRTPGGTVANSVWLEKKSEVGQRRQLWADGFLPDNQEPTNRISSIAALADDLQVPFLL